MLYAACRNQKIDSPQKVLYRQRELGTLARINRVVDRATGQGQVEAEVITLTVGNREVLPVTQNIALVRQLGCELEVVIRPLQTLTEHHCKTIHLDRFVREQPSGRQCKRVTYNICR